MTLLNPYRFAATGKDPAAYAAVVSADSPHGWLRLDEAGAANPVESGVTGLTPLLDGSYVWGKPGAVGTALQFDGSSVRILYASSGRISLSVSKSYVCWVKTTSTDATSAYAGNAALTIFGDYSGSVWESFGVHGGKARFTRFNNSAWQTFDSATSVNDGAWHLIAVTYNHSTRAVVIYVDGVPDGGGTMTAHQNQGGVNVYGQGYPGGQDWFQGDLDEIEVHGVVLSAARILARWNA